MKAQTTASIPFVLLWLAFVGLMLWRSLWMLRAGRRDGRYPRAFARPLSREEQPDKFRMATILFRISLVMLPIFLIVGLIMLVDLMAK